MTNPTYLIFWLGLGLLGHSSYGLWWFFRFRRVASDPDAPRIRGTVPQHVRRLNASLWWPFSLGTLAGLIAADYDGGKLAILFAVIGGVIGWRAARRLEARIRERVLADPTYTGPR